MEKLTDYLTPLLLALISLAALEKRQNSYQIFLDGCNSGLRLLLSICPALIGLMTAIELMQASGAMALIESRLAPLLSPLGIPAECMPLILIRPFSGSGALAVGIQLISQYGVDSQIGRTAAVMLGSTETTFYTISVYFSAAGVSKTRYTIPAALFADFVGFTVAAWSVMWMFG